MNFGSKLFRAGIGVAFLLLVGVGWGAHGGAREQARSAFGVARTHEVIHALEQVASGLARAESSLRGYAVARDPTFLTELEPAIRDATSGLADAAQLTLDNPSQYLRIQLVKPLLARRVELLRLREKELEAGAKAQIPPEAQRLSERIRALTEDAVRIERTLLEERRALLERRTSQAQLWTWAGSVLGVLLVFGALALRAREMRRRA